MTQPPGYGPPPGQPAAPGPYAPRPPYPPAGYYMPPPVPVSPAGVPLADYGSRLLAQLIDVVLLGVLSAIVFVPSFFLIVSHAPFADEADPDPLAVLGFIFLIEAGFLVFALAVWYLYAVEWMHRTGQTLGKRIMNIRVVPLDPRLRLTRLTAFKRYAAEFLPSVLIPFYTLIDDLWPLWDRPFQQALHDKAAQTVVVKVSA